MDFLKYGSDWLQEMRATHLVTLVSYWRCQDVANISATVGKKKVLIDPGFGLDQRIDGFDFLILASDLILNEELSEPQAGDKIKVLSDAGDKNFVYEVWAPTYEKIWEWSDSFNKTMRVHTRYTCVEDVE